MPVFDQGYQHWNGHVSGQAWRWLAITRHGVRTQMRSRWVFYLFMLSLLPALLLAGFMILWGLIEQKSSLVAPFLSMLKGLPPEILEGPKAFRVSTWTMAFQMFFASELFFTMLLVMMVGPSLISQDLRFNAIPLYLSRPLRRIDYFLGKLGIIGFYLFCVTVVPTLLAYLLGICFSLDLSVIKDTSHLLLASLIYGAIVIVSAGTFMLALSSLSRNSRIIGILWFGIWMITDVMAGMMTMMVHEEWCPAISYTACLKRTNELLIDSDKALAQLMETFARASNAMPPNAGGFNARGGRGGPGIVIHGGQSQRPRRPRDDEPRFEPPPPMHWYWPAAVLTGLLGLSLCTLSLRVKSLDRLK